MIEGLAAQLTRRRLLIVASVLLPFTIFLELAVVWSDPANRWRFPLGHDYVAFWTAATLYAEGGLPRLYDYEAFEALQNTLSVRPGLLLWLYPPIYLILILPLAAVSFVVGYLLFTAVNVGAIAAVYPRIRPFPGVLGWTALLGSPVMVGAIVQGQNGAFFAACIIGGVFAREKGWPWLSAFLFALVLAKPQYGPLLPVILIALGDWRGILRITAFCIAYILVATAIVGVEAWPYFVENARALRVSLSEPELLSHMPTVWAALSILGLGGSTAFAIHGLVALLAALGVWRLWAQPTASPDLRLAALLFGTLLITPYAYRYDMVLTLAGTLLLMRYGAMRGFGAGEKLVLAFLWIWPAFFAPVALSTGLQTGPLISIAGLILCLHHRRRAETGDIGRAELAV